MFTNSERKILRKIRNEVHRDKEYNFWFVYDEGGKAIGWEGGYELPKYVSFRNDFTLPVGSSKRIIRTPIQLQ